MDRSANYNNQQEKTNKLIDSYFQKNYLLFYKDL